MSVDHSMCLHTVNALPPGLSWASTGLKLGQNPLIIYNQPPSMTVHQIQPQMAMHFPVTAATLPIPTRTPEVSAPQGQKFPQLKQKLEIVKGPYIGKQKQLLSIPVTQLMPVAGNQTAPNRVYVVNNLTKSTGIESKSSVETEMSSPQGSQAMDVPLSETQQASVASIPTVNDSVVDVTLSTLNTGSCASENHSASNIEIVTLNAESNQAPSTSVTLCNAGIETYPILKQALNNQTNSIKIESNTFSVETKTFSTQKSQVSITPSSKFPQVCFASTENASVLSMTPCTIGSSTDVNPSPSSIQSAITHAKINQVSSTPLAFLNSDACNKICSNPIQSVNDLTESIQNKSKSMSAETSHQKSQAIVSPSSEFLQTCIGPTDVSVISMAPSALTIATSAESVITTTSVSCVVSNLSVPTVSPITPISCLTDGVLSVSSSKPSFSKAHNEAVTSYQINTTETIVTNNYSKPFKPRELSLEPIKDKKPLMVTVKPRVLTHVIDGFIFQESSVPFPVNQLPFSDTSSRILLPKDLNLPEERGNSLTVPNPEKKVRTFRSRKNVELAKCEFCSKPGPKFGFRRKKRFCSKYCSKQFNKHPSKQVKKPVPTIKQHMVSGVYGHGKKESQDRKCLQTQLLEDENANAVTEEILSVSEIQSTAPCPTDEENSAPFDKSYHTPMEIDKNMDELGLLKSNLSQKLPSKWTIQEVFEFIQDSPGYSVYADNFKSQEVDGQALLMLNENHLKTNICMKLGPAIKLLSQIRTIKEKMQS